MRLICLQSAAAMPKVHLPMSTAAPCLVTINLPGALQNSMALPVWGVCVFWKKGSSAVLFPLWPATAPDTSECELFRRRHFLFDGTGAGKIVGGGLLWANGAAFEVMSRQFSDVKSLSGRHCAYDRMSLPPTNCLKR